MAAPLDIGVVAQRTGLRPSALRFYERAGLIRPIGRRGLRRQYNAEVLERLAMISLAMSIGFTIADLQAIFGGRLSDAAIRRQMAAKADELDRRIADMTATRDHLRHAAVCKSPRIVDCQTLRKRIREMFSPSGERRATKSRNTMQRSRAAAR